MSETPKKKPAKKVQPAKKAQPKKPASATSHPSARRGRPPKKATASSATKTVAQAVDRDADSLITEVVKPAPPKPSVVIHANDVKQKSLRQRMLKWFKK